MLEIQHLSKTFRTGLFRRKTVLHDVSLSLGPGIYGLLGPNGAGKTTLLRSITGVYKVQNGAVLFRGKSISNNKEFTRNIGYLPQKFGLYKDMTVSEMLEYLAIMKGVPQNECRAAIKEALESVNLLLHKNDRIKTLSGGMLRRVGIAQAILGKPQIIIFDEPTTGLDPEERVRFKSMIAKLPKTMTILLSTHIVDDVEAVCDNIILINDGKISATGTSGEIAAIANGKLYSVPLNMQDALKEPYYIIRQEMHHGIETVRVLSPLCQCGDALAPTVEDGYLCRMKGFG